jgi:O-antigen/teichoic acid export membrane protein
VWRLLATKIKSSASRDGAWALASQVVSSAATFAVSILIVRSIGYEEFGRFSICFLALIVIRNLQGGLISTPMSTIWPELPATSFGGYRYFLLYQIVTFATVTSITLILIFSSIALIFDLHWLYSLLFPSVLANLFLIFSEFFRRYWVVSGSSLRGFLTEALRSATQVAVTFALPLCFAGQGSLGASSFVYTLAVAGAIGMLAGAISFGRIERSTGLNNVVWPRHRRFIRWMTPTVLLESIQSTGLVLIAAPLLGEAAVGVLRTIESLSNLVALPLNAAAGVAPVLGSRAQVVGGDKKMWRSLLSLTYWTLVLMLSASALLVLVADFLFIHVLPTPPQDAHQLLLTFLTATLVATARMPLIVALQVHDRPGLVFGIACISSLSGLAVLAFTIGHISALSVPVARVVIVVTGVLASFLLIMLKTRATR